MSRRSSDALKWATVWPLLLAALAAATLAAASAATPGARAAGVPCGESTAAPGELTLHQMRTSVLCLINRVRVHYGLDPLDYNLDLRTSATRHSVSMVVNDYFAHEGPGGSMDSRISRAGYLGGARDFVIGEDIGGGRGGRWASPMGVFEAWMQSPPHRENILDPSFRDAGVGVARGFPFGGGSGAATYTVDFGARHG